MAGDGRPFGAEADAIAERIAARIDALLPEPTPRETHDDPPPGIGVAIQNGPLRPEYGPDWCYVICSLCGATWTGYIGDWCTWCENRLDYQRERAERLRVERERERNIVRGWNRCPTHNHLWRGLPLEVCGAHGGPWRCNERAVPVTYDELERLRP